MPRKTDHLVINTLTGKVNCLHCGAEEDFNSKMPMPIEAVQALLLCYRKQHKRCEESQAGIDRRAQNLREWEEYLKKNPWECPDCGKYFPDEATHTFCEWRKK